jgi:hypothetical protein
MANPGAADCISLSRARNDQPRGPELIVTTETQRHREDKEEKKRVMERLPEN